jgi:hypothetical protein
VLCRREVAKDARLLVAGHENAVLLRRQLGGPDFRREMGLEALEVRFDEHAIDPVDPKRASVV